MLNAIDELLREGKTIRDNHKLEAIDEIDVLSNLFIL